MNPSNEETLRQGFKRYLNPFMVFMWRLGLGPFINFAPTVSGRIMVIAHTGRKTGRRRFAPVNYAVVDGEIYCTAGFGGISDWYRNLMAKPEAEVWLPDGWWAATVEDVSDSEQRLPLLRHVLIASGFAARAAGIDPFHISDEALTKTAAHYRLLHLKRMAARTGPGGPGDLAWVWPLAAMVLLPLAMRKRKR
ncbi:MAG: nitroreductase family deazaflavin-dependent oxidoreductase [Chloroflexi bacterium]|nr:nitroreductase family deazaflavin-dependent oxidoreductase [Chloroflexota bacterium]